MTRLCAEAMGYKPLDKGLVYAHDSEEPYDPLRDDAQAFALVKRFSLAVGFDSVSGRWTAISDKGQAFDGDSDNLNRAIVECVAKMQAVRPRLAHHK